MVLLMLKIKADLENITNLNASGGSDGSEFTYYFQIKCGSCGEHSEKQSSITSSEQYPIPKSRGTAHLVQKCKRCDNVGNISLLADRQKSYTFEDSEAGRYGSIACFDCRGIEPANFIPKDGWTADGVTGSKFVDIDLAEGDWSEYDDHGKVAVGIMNFQSKFDVTK